jgi:hypothetical protein
MKLKYRLTSSPKRLKPKKQVMPAFDTPRHLPLMARKTRAKKIPKNK